MTGTENCALDLTDPRIRELSGCPLRKNVFGRLLCYCGGCNYEDVTNYIMCEVDWESCKDYRAQQIRDRIKGITRGKPLI